MLKQNYESEESLNEKFWNFNSASQHIGEDRRDCLMRDQHLSRVSGLLQNADATLSAGEETVANTQLDREKDFGPSHCCEWFERCKSLGMT